MRPAQRADALFNSLRFRVLGMLSLALLPIGLIAVNQTKQVADAARLSAELSLLARTEQAALQERLVISQARGAASVLGSITGLLDNPETCRENLAKFADEDTPFSFVGILPPSGVITCSSNGVEFDFSGFDGFADDMANPRSTVVINKDAPMSQKSVIVVSEPFYEDGVFGGFISVSIPHERLDALKGTNLKDGLVNVVSLNADGDILTSEGPIEGARQDLPSVGSLANLLGQGAYSFSADDGRGNDRIYSVVPIVDNTVYVIGVWDPTSGAAGKLLSGTPPATFPILMWLVSLGVALFAVHRLVTRHIRRLGLQMRRFARDRSLEDEETGALPPAELAEMEHDFRDMAAAILQDEAQLENSLRDKNVLIKEVHHRVKNNLQLISSIMNMQIRKSDNAETKEVLGRVQDRVLSLATIHRDLYQSQNAGRVNAGNLIIEIIEKTVEIGTGDQDEIDLRMSVAPISLYPDQAVPLSLLVAEAATNAMKYIATDAHGNRWIEVVLTEDAPHDYNLRIGNSVGTTKVPSSDQPSGLGTQLIRAFAIQLGGQHKVELTDDAYWIRFSFKAMEFSAEAVDY